MKLIGINKRRLQAAGQATACGIINPFANVFFIIRYLDHYEKQDLSSCIDWVIIWSKYAYKNALNIIKTGVAYGSNSPVKAVSDIEKPIFFIHGRNDEVIPCEMSECLYDKKKGMRIFVQVLYRQRADRYTARSSNLCK